MCDALELSKFSIFPLKRKNHRKVHLDHHEGEVDGLDHSCAILRVCPGCGLDQV